MLAAACGNGHPAGENDGGVIAPSDGATGDGPATTSDGATLEDAGDAGSTVIPPGSMVTGRVVDTKGSAQGQVTVEIGGVLAVTDAAGGFSLPAPASTPFSIKLSGKFSTGGFMQTIQTVGMLFTAVDRLDPTLMLPLAASTPTNANPVSGTITGTLAGLGKPMDATSTVVISPLGSVGNASVGTYSLVQRWLKADAADTSRTVAVSALFWKGFGASQSFLAYGKSADVVITAGQTTPGVTITTATPTIVQIPGTVAASASLQTVSVSATIALGNATFAAGARGVTLAGPTAFSLPVPLMDGAQYDVLLQSNVAARTTSLLLRRITPGTDLGAQTLSDPPALIEPANASTVPVAGTLLRVQDPESRARVFSIVSADATLFVLTADKEIAIPDFSMLGIAAPSSGTKVDWSVKRYTVATPAEAVGPLGYAGDRSDRAAIQPGETYAEARSETFSFFVQ
ncbi:MAG: hypothetical protein ABI445_11370 [Polyangia bacterium]